MLWQTHHILYTAIAATHLWQLTLPYMKNGKPISNCEDSTTDRGRCSLDQKSQRCYKLTSPSDRTVLCTPGAQRGPITWTSRMASNYATWYLTATQTIWALSGVLWLGLSAVIRVLWLECCNCTTLPYFKYLPRMMATFEAVVSI